MKNLRNKKLRRNIFKELIVPVSVFALMLAVFIVGFVFVRNSSRAQNIELLRQAVKRTALECYSVEGFYPPEVTYLEDNYSLNYDHDRYLVFYDCFSSNMMPTIDVYEKK